MLRSEKSRLVLSGWSIRYRSAHSVLPVVSRKDFDAVLAAVETSWSNRQTEGQSNRLKAIKRQTYGRAGFRLLRARALPYSAMAPLAAPKARKIDFCTGADTLIGRSLHASL